MLALRVPRLFTGVVGGVHTAVTVLVRDGLIVSVGRSDPPAEADRLELPGTTLLPGLVDGHAHLTWDASTEAVRHVQSATDDELIAVARTAARRALAAGITTVRDLGDRGYVTLRLRSECAAHPAAGPTVLAAGPPVTTPDGHCWFLGGVAATEAELRAAVRERAGRGVDVVKVMASGGGMTFGSRPQARQYDLARLRVLATEAHRHGLPVTAHAHATHVIADVVAAGFDGVEHCSFLPGEDLPPGGEPGGGPADGPGGDVDVSAAALLAALVRSGITVSLTPGVLPGAPEPPAGTITRIPPMYDTIRRLHEAGARLIVSSDGGISPGKPHDFLPHAVACVAGCGVPPQHALAAATSAAADACGLGHLAGRIAPGYRADLLAVAGDPLTDIAALHRPVAVFRHGVRVR
jgi:imidazolonepropionase-like amidohydrolase